MNILFLIVLLSITTFLLKSESPQINQVYFQVFSSISQIVFNSFKLPKEYKGIVLKSISLAQLLEDSDTISFDSIISELSLESYVSCHSNFQSYDSTSSISENSNEDLEKIDESQPNRNTREIIQMIKDKDFKRLQRLSRCSSSSALDELLLAVKMIISKYNGHKGRIISKLQVCYRDVVRNAAEISKLERELESLDKRLICYLTYYDYYTYEIFKSQIKKKVKIFAKTLKQLRLKDNHHEILILQSKLAFQDELISILNSSFTYFLCEHKVLAELRLCKFIEKEFLKVTKYRERLAALHKEAISKQKPPRQENSENFRQGKNTGTGDLDTRQRGLLSRVSARLTKAFRTRRSRK